jgi:hypothetical protein
MLDRRQRRKGERGAIRELGIAIRNKATHFKPVHHVTTLIE